MLPVEVIIVVFAVHVAAAATSRALAWASASLVTGWEPTREEEKRLLRFFLEAQPLPLPKS